MKITPVSIDDLQAGMIVARDVIDQRGAMLMQNGAALTSQMIEILKKRGIEEVLITTPEEESKRRATQALEAATIRARRETALTAKATEKLNIALAMLDEQFMGMNEDEIMVAVKTAAVEYWQGQMEQMSKGD